MFKYLTSFFLRCCIYKISSLNIYENAATTYQVYQVMDVTYLLILAENVGEQWNPY